MDLLQRVIKAYIGGGGGNDWKFCLLPETVVSELVTKKAIRGKTVYRRCVFTLRGMINQQSIRQFKLDPEPLITHLFNSENEAVNFE